MTTDTTPIKSMSKRSHKKVSISDAVKKIENLRTLTTEPKRRIIHSTPIRALALSPKFDLRIFDPSRHKTSIRRRVDDRRMRIVAHPASLFSNHLKFHEPIKNLPCQRRKSRRRALFAFGLTGKGSRAKRHHFNLDSAIKC